ncbi:hypothetical protein GGS21DRAFT_386134 [Xylaria nigripes]|nr:hypothetical protein GGS21DRAFT_386134 [Xylaria nigripes]
MDEVDVKSSKHKHTAGTKKRNRDSTHADSSERKHKRSKGHASSTLDQGVGEAVDSDHPTSPVKHDKKNKRSSKSTDSRSHTSRMQLQTETPTSDADEDVKATETRKSSKKESRRSRKSDGRTFDETITAQLDVAVLDSAPSTSLPDGKQWDGHQYPFYTQTVSQYLPLRPLGISEPIQGFANQHLKPLLHRHVPSFGGVLLAYRYPRIGEAPGVGSLLEESDMDDVALLESVNEYAVSFAWLTVEIDLFRPARGAWLEGLVNFQGEGHIGLVCWGKFNASIEAARLPRDWRWIDHLSSGKKGSTGIENALSPLPSPDDDVEAGHTPVHATGYWVDGRGLKIASDTSICFRIKNYEVGSSGEYGYLSIEGTMLPEEEEAKKVREEVQNLRQKIKHGSIPRRERRPLLELSMTRFTNDDEQEPGSQPTQV